MQNQTPVLTISLLISNRPDTIPRCLDSLKPIMDAVSSELILIDTSKSAEVHKMLLEYTDQVYEFEWCQDFAKARNEGLKRAKGEWFLFLDDDEWFAEVDDIIKFFQSGEYKDYGYANYQVRNFYDVEYTRYDDAWVTRMFRIDPDTEFRGRVHELFYPIRDKVKHLDILVNHSGYIFENKEKVRQHFERNSKILLEIIEEDPINLRWQAQMVQEYRTVQKWDAIVEFCQKHLENVKTLKTNMERYHLCTLYAGLIEGLMRLGRHEESISICRQALEDERSIELLRALVYLRLTENYVALENLKAAKKYIDRYLECYKVMSADAALMREQSNSLVVRHVFEKEYVKTAYSILIYVDLKKSSLNALHKYYHHLGWDDKDLFVYEKLAKYLVEIMSTMKYDAIFGRIIADAHKNETFRKLICAEASQWEEKDEKAFLNIAYAFAQADAEFWFIWYTRIIVADANNNKREMEKAITGLLHNVSNVFYLPEKVDQIIAKHDIKIALLWEKVIEDKWEKQVTFYVVKNDEKHLTMTRERLNDVFLKNDWKIISFELAVMEKLIVAGPKTPWNMQEYYDLLKTYADLKPFYYQNKHLKADTIENLASVPNDVHAALKIKEYIDMEAQDKVQALGKLKEAVEICRVFADGIGKYLHSYPEFECQRADKQKKEMQQLRNQVMEQVKVMAANGQEQAALQIIQQLKQMFPDDLEVKELGLKIRIQTLE